MFPIKTINKLKFKTINKKIPKIFTFHKMFVLD